MAERVTPELVAVRSTAEGITEAEFTAAFAACEPEDQALIVLLIARMLRAQRRRR